MYKTNLGASLVRLRKELHLPGTFHSLWQRFCMLLHRSSAWGGGAAAAAHSLQWVLCRPSHWLVPDSLEKVEGILARCWRPLLGIKIIANFEGQMCAGRGLLCLGKHGAKPRSIADAKWCKLAGVGDSAIMPFPVCNVEMLLPSCSCSLVALPFDVALRAKWRVFTHF